MNDGDVIKIDAHDMILLRSKDGTHIYCVLWSHFGWPELSWPDDKRFVISSGRVQDYHRFIESTLIKVYSLKRYGSLIVNSHEPSYSMKYELRDDNNSLTIKVVELPQLGGKTGDTDHPIPE